MKNTQPGPMKDITVKEKFQLAGMLLFAGTLPFDREMNQVLYCIFLLSSLPLLSRKLFIERKNLILLTASLYLIVILSSIISTDVSRSLSKMDISLSFLLTPFIMGSSYIPSSFKNRLVKMGFVAGVVSALLLLFFILTWKMATRYVSIDELLDMRNMNHGYSAPIGIHATFFSTYVALSIAFLLEELERTAISIRKIFIVLLIVLCVASLFLLLSRVVLAACGICFLFYLFKQNRKKAILPKILAVIFVSSIVFFFSGNSHFSYKFSRGLQRDIKWREWSSVFSRPADGQQIFISANDGSRVERWFAAAELIGERPLTGFGNGMEKPALFEKYIELGLTVSYEKGYDAHNQFLSVGVQAGVPGMLWWIFFFAFCFYLAYKKQQKIYLSFLFITVSVCLIDNYLGVNKGIFFFTFFNTFFLIGMAHRASAAKN